MAIADGAEKAVSEQRDNLLAEKENHSTQGTTHSLNDTVGCLRGELEKAQWPSSHSQSSCSHRIISG